MGRMDTPQKAVLRLYDLGLSKRDIVRELLVRHRIHLDRTTILRVGTGQSDPRSSTGAALMKLAEQMSPQPVKRKRAVRA